MLALSLNSYWCLAVGGLMKRESVVGERKECGGEKI